MNKTIFLIFSFLAFQLFSFSAQVAVVYDTTTGEIVSDITITDSDLPSSVLLDSDLTSDDYSITGDWTFDGGLEFVDFTDLTFHSDPYYTRLTNSDISANSTLYLPEGGGTLLTRGLSDTYYPSIVTDQSTRSAVDLATLGDRAQGVLRLHDKLGAVASGTENRLMVLQIGDSLTERVAKYLQSRHLAEWYPQPEGVSAHADVGIGAIAKGGTVVVGTGTGEDLAKDDYTLNFVGSHVDIDAGEYMHFGANSTQKIEAADRVIIPYVIESGAGSFRVRLSEVDAGMLDSADASWTDVSAGDIAQGPVLTGSELIVDASGSFGLGIIELEFSATRAVALQLMHSAGSTVRFLHPMFETNATPAVNVYHMGEGSNDFSSIDSASYPIMARLISELQPDIITLQSDDGGASCEVVMDGLKLALDQTTLGYEPLVIAIGNGPKDGSQSSMQAQNDALAAKATEYNFGFFSLLDLVPTYPALDELGFGGDGTHLSADFYELAAHHIATAFGFNFERGQLVDPLGVKAAAQIQWVIDMGDASFSSTGVVGSATYTLDAPYWEFGTGTTADSELTRYLNDFGGPYQFRSTSYQVSYTRPTVMAFAVRVDAADAEGEFWLHYGTSAYNAAGAFDQSSKSVSFKLENCTPILQTHDGTTLTESLGASDHSDTGVASSEIWRVYRIYFDGVGGAYLFQDGLLVAHTSTGAPTGISNTGGFRLAIKNGASGNNYRVFITPPVITPIY